MTTTTTTTTTTITLNGALGSHFLAQLRPRLPRPLVELLAASARAQREGPPVIEVETRIADQLAAFVEGVLAEGEVQVDGPPLLFSPELGDHVLIARDALVELEVARKAKPLWCSIARGTRGRLIARRGSHGRVYLTDGPFVRQYIYVTDRSMTRVRPVSDAPRH